MSQPTPTPLPPQAVLFQMLAGKWLSAAISTAARLGIADHLESGPKAAQDLAAATGMNPDALYRLLRSLAGFGVFHEDAGRVFSQTSLSDLLRTNSRPCMRNMAMMLGDDWHVKIWGELPWSVETGRPAPYKVYGMGGFEYFAQHPDQAVNFNNAMTDLSQGDAPAVVASYDFSAFKRIVDVGGGLGMLLAAILQSAPQLRGTLIDLPYVIDKARASPMLAPFADRCEFAGGSFFEAVPPDADAYIMKHIIHDWDDQRAIQILTNCREALAPGGKLLVVDQVIGPANQPDPAKLMDLEMLVAPGGRERDEPEWRALFSASGFHLKRIIPTPSPQCILEGVPA